MTFPLLITLESRLSSLTIAGCPGGSFKHAESGSSRALSGSRLADAHLRCEGLAPEAAVIDALELVDLVVQRHVVLVPEELHQGILGLVDWLGE